jgi:hypothetical protein
MFNSSYSIVLENSMDVLDNIGRVLFFFFDITIQYAMKRSYVLMELCVLFDKVEC